MTENTAFDYEPGVLRVFQSKDETKAYYNKIAKVYDRLPDLPHVLAEWKRVLRPGGRLAVVAISKQGKQGVIMKAYEWTHKHFPNLMDCRPIFVSRAIEAAGFTIEKKRRNTCGFRWKSSWASSRYEPSGFG
jgi:SAM-dependent methyltransferase